MSVSKHDQSWTLRLGTSHPGSPELGQGGLRDVSLMGGKGMTEESDGRRRGNPAIVLLLGWMLLLVLYIVSPIPLSYVLNH